MNGFVWGSVYKTGVPEMDCEHIILFSLYNQLCAVIDENKQDEAMDDICQALVTYIKIHFLHEEQMLELAGFPDLEKHRAGHRDIIAGIDALHATYRSTNATNVARDLRALVFSWLAGHVLKDDKAYGAFINAATPA